MPHGYYGRKTGRLQVSLTSEHRAWRNAKDRCTNPNHASWKRYGGRGITMHPAWLNSFQTFLSYIGNKPTPLHSLDRYPNKDGNYEPGNVRWATSEEQAFNRTTPKEYRTKNKP